MTQLDRLSRERDFFDHAVPTVDEAMELYERGPDPNTRLMLESVRPAPGRRILDFACGTGVSSAWLASRGAEVTGIDLSPACIEVAKQIARRAEVKIEFICDDVERMELRDGRYDAVVGRYALHHLDVARVAPVLARCVGPDGTGAFLETMGINPILALARRQLVGRYGVPRFGTYDEHPLLHGDIAALKLAFGSAALATEEFHFLTMLDRQVLRSRLPSVVPLLHWSDSNLGRSRMFRHWGYHQVILLSRKRVREETLLREMVTDVPKRYPRGAATWTNF